MIAIVMQSEARYLQSAWPLHVCVPSQLGELVVRWCSLGNEVGSGAHEMRATTQNGEAELMRSKRAERAH